MSVIKSYEKIYRAHFFAVQRDLHSGHVKFGPQTVRIFAVRDAHIAIIRENSPFLFSSSTYRRLFARKILFLSHTILILKIPQIYICIHTYMNIYIFFCVLRPVIRPPLYIVPATCRHLSCIVQYHLRGYTNGLIRGYWRPLITSQNRSAGETMRTTICVKLLVCIICANHE